MRLVNITFAGAHSKTIGCAKSLVTVKVCSEIDRGSTLTAVGIGDRERKDDQEKREGKESEEFI